jgi:hypothetical protein
MGLLVATGLVPEEALKHGLDARAWEVGASLPLLASGHFAFVEGTPDLEPLPRVEIPPTELVIEGLRRYDEWRNRPVRNGTSAHAAP